MARPSECTARGDRSAAVRPAVRRLICEQAKTVGSCVCNGRHRLRTRKWLESKPSSDGRMRSTGTTIYISEKGALFTATAMYQSWNVGKRDERSEKTY